MCAQPWVYMWGPCCALLGVSSPLPPMSCQQLRWSEAQQMASGLRLGAEERTRASLQALGPGSCLETCRGAGVEVFWSHHMAWGRAAGPRGRGSRGPACW